MYKIESKIEIKKRISVYKKTFIKEELFPIVKTRFFCPTCNNEQHIEIIPFKSGFLFHELYEKEYLQRQIILKEGMAKAPFFNNNSKALLVWNLPTFYYGMECSKCLQKYIVVFGLGEQQPGKDVFQISGVWSYNEIKNERNDTEE